MDKSKKFRFFYITSLFLIAFSIFFLDTIISIFFKYINIADYYFIMEIRDYVLISVATILLFFIAIKYLIKKQKIEKIKNLLFIITSLVITLFFSFILKILFGRLRPINAIQPLNFNILSFSNIFWSFPSMHTSLTMAFCFSVYLLYYKKYNHMYLIFLIPLIVGISQIMFLQHYFSDVLFSIFLGVVVTIYSKDLIDEKFKKNKGKK